MSETKGLTASTPTNKGTAPAPKRPKGVHILDPRGPKSMIFFLFFGIGDHVTSLTLSVYMVYNSEELLWSIVAIAVSGFLTAFSFIQVARLMRLVTGSDPESQLEGTTHLVLCSPFGWGLLCAPCLWQTALWRAVNFRKQAVFKWYELVYFLLLDVVLGFVLIIAYGDLGGVPVVLLRAFFLGCCGLYGAIKLLTRLLCPWCPTSNPHPAVSPTNPNYY